MKVYRLPARQHEPADLDAAPLGAVVGAATFQRRFLTVLDMRLDRIGDHAHALLDGNTPHFMLAAIQEEVQNVASTAASAGWLTLALLARDVDRTIQQLWRSPITTTTARTVLPSLQNLLTEGART